MPKYLVASDLDDTLLTTDKEITIKSLRHIHKFIKNDNLEKEKENKNIKKKKKVGKEEEFIKKIEKLMIYNQKLRKKLPRFQKTKEICSRKNLE